MVAHKSFEKYYRKRNIINHYWSKIAYKNSVGLDRISNRHFQKHLENEIDIINRKVNNGKYKFTTYKELLISKGANKPPRTISIPTVRDQLTLSLCNEFLKETFDYIEFPLVQEIIDSIGKSIITKKYNSYVKVDISHFYPSINHELLLKKLRTKIRKKEILNLITSAIKNPTIPITGRSKSAIQNSVGVPEGVAISNILANIYLYDLSEKIKDKYDIAFFRYVDDILILCDFKQVEYIYNDLIHMLSYEYHLESNAEKDRIGYLADGVTYLGYEFFNDRISVSDKSISRIEHSLDELFKTSKRINSELFIWKLNLKITGCIFENKKYGWLFFYSQLTDISVLYHLDWLIDILCKRYNVKKDGIKRFVRTYHEIRNNQHESKYLINADKYNDLDKRLLLAETYKVSVDKLKGSEEEIDKKFRRFLFKDLSSLEKDIQNFS